VNLRPPSSRSRFLAAGEQRVYVQEWGEGPTLLCVHGLGGGAHFFGALGPTLAGTARSVAIDLPGCGLSPRTGTCSFEAAAALLIELARRNAWAPLVLLGHSMGTIIALEVVRQARELVRGLVLVGGLPEPRTAARSRIAQRIDHVRREGLAGIGEQAVAANFSERTRSERPELTGLFARAFELQSADGYVSWGRTLCAWRAKPLPPLDRIPALVVTGEEDLYAPPADVEAFVQELRRSRPVSDARLEIMADCGHLPFLERPAAFAALVRAFREHRS
jgi:pimeloyl-ACP methyl ester carboxylesterase